MIVESGGLLTRRENIILLINHDRSQTYRQTKYIVVCETQIWVRDLSRDLSGDFIKNINL
jgi:hypothetical protein